jgi:hypothetical protein
MATWFKLFRRGLDTENESASDALQFTRKDPGMVCAAVAGTGGKTILAMPAVVVAPAIGVLQGIY